MKTLHAITLCIVWGMFCSACSTGLQPIKVSPEQGALIEQLAVTAGGAAALNKNPKYIPAAEALAGGISAALASNSTITPQLIGDYVNRVCKQNNVSDADIPLFSTLANMIYDAYVGTFKTTVISSTDPTALLYINAFRDGLLTASAIAGAAKK